MASFVTSLAYYGPKREWTRKPPRALGTLQGRGDLAELERRGLLTEAKRAVFGTSNRRLSAANQLIAQAAAKAAPAEEDRRLMPVRGGDEGYLEV